MDKGIERSLDRGNKTEAKGYISEGTGTGGWSQLLLTIHVFSSHIQETHQEMR